MSQPDHKVSIRKKHIAVLLVASLAACSHTTPDNPDPDRLTTLAKEMHAKGDDGMAANFYRQALNLHPDDVKTRQAYAELLENAQDDRGALEQYQHLAAQDPDDGAALRSEGRLFLKMNQPDDARAAYADALKLDNSDTKALNGLGVGLDTTGNHEAAQESYSEALADKPGDITSLTNLGHSYVLSGAWDKAIALLEPHIHDEACTPALRQNLAEAYGMNGMDVDADRMARLDLPADQAARNIALYHQRRLALTPAAQIYADMGHFPTSEMAANNADEIEQKLMANKEGLSAAVATEVTTAGSTPEFSVHVTGFRSSVALHAFCQHVRDQQGTCTEHHGL